MTLQESSLDIRAEDAVLLDYIIAHAQTQGDQTAFVFIGRDGSETCYSFADLLSGVSDYAEWISAQVQPGDRILLALDSGPAYVLSFLGALAVGAVPVPLFPPETRRDHHMARFRVVMPDAEPALILTEAEAQDALRPLSDCPVLDAALCPEATGALVAARARPENLAFLQYTSGSTSAPKGVMVSHGNLVANALSMIESCALTKDDVLVSWLPIYHDMGLIAKVVMPLVAGVKAVNMSPKRFLMRPERWLQAISDHRGTLSGGPDFAYRLCADVIGESARSRLDLSSWRIAFSGSEPVRRSTLDAFASSFGPSGFACKASSPCYGLAEATLGVTGVPPERVSTDALAPGSEQSYVDCGPPMPGVEIRIGGAQFDMVPTESIGEVYVHSPSVTQGYWKNPQATAESFREIDGKRWLRTGDLGFIKDGSLFLTGRAKDLIILDGQNLFPQDIESHLELRHDRIRSGRVAAYSSSQNDHEGYGVALEVSGTADISEFDAFAQDIAIDLSAAFPKAPSQIQFLPARALPRTSSGKLQRRQASEIPSHFPEMPLYIWEGQHSAGTRELSVFEATISRFWSEALGQLVTDPDANFFVLGGTSVQAMRLLAQIEKQLGLSVDPAILFSDPTLSAMSAKLQETSPRDAIPLSVSSDLVHLSGLGLYFWFLSRFGLGGVCNVACGVRFSSGLDVNVLREALDRVVARQEALRLRFVEGADGGLSAQAVPADAAQVVLQQVDLSSFAPEVAEARLAALSEQDAGDQIDLLNSPGW
ncbi:MAG: AMP-binding protein, partial [Pseudomonadota bacterium]